MNEDQGRPAVRVLIVDDSPAVRRLLARAIAGEPGIELAATADDGQAALAAVERDRPDVVILDLGLPGLSGTEVLAALGRFRPAPPIVIFSGLPRGDSGAVWDAVSSGAVQFVPKPAGASALRPLAYMREELFPVVRMIAGRSEPPAVSPASGAVRRPAASTREVPRLITVASSTGGPDALAKLVSRLRPFPDVAVLAVQHMPRQFTAMLAQRLDLLTVARVSEATDGQPVVPGEILVAPGGEHLSVVRRGADLVARVADGPKVNYCRPSADVLFAAAAQACGPRVLAVVLSGMGRDGAEGSAAVVAAGGEVMAQSAASAVCASMPAAVAHLATATLDVDGLAEEILRRCARTGVR